MPPDGLSHAAGGRLRSHSSTSVRRNPMALPVSWIGAGKLLSGDRLSLQTVVRLRLSISHTSLVRRTSGFINPTGTRPVSRVAWCKATSPRGSTAFLV